MFTVLLGLAYPLVTTGVAQVLFPEQADGSQIERDGKVVGSTPDRPGLQGQAARLLPVAPVGHRLQRRRHLLQQPRAEQPRAGAASSAKNLAAYLRRERPYNPGLQRARRPVDAVTTSASGVDPHISQANAQIQARRVAEVRGLALRTRARADRREHRRPRRSACSASPG